jgi:hypothetical protein
MESKNVILQNKHAQTKKRDLSGSIHLIKFIENLELVDLARREKCPKSQDMCLHFKTKLMLPPAAKNYKKIM